MTALSEADIRRLFELLNDELRQIDTLGEVFLVGGAVLCLLRKRLCTRWKNCSQQVRHSICGIAATIIGPRSGSTCARPGCGFRARNILDATRARAPLPA